MAPKKRKYRPGFLARVSSPWSEEAEQSSHADAEVVVEFPAPSEGPPPRSSLRPKCAPGPGPGCAATPGASGRIPRTPTTVDRKNAPVLAPRARGSLDTALRVAQDPDELQAAIVDYNLDVLASSSKATADSLWNNWVTLHEATKSGQQVLPLTPEGIHAVATLVKAGGFRSVNVLYRAKREHCVHHAWNDNLQLALKDAKRSILRGIGPAKQAAPLTPEGVGSLNLSKEALAVEGPVNPCALVILGAFFLARELELACARTTHLIIDEVAGIVKWTLPTSKTDQQGQSTTRAWGCTCGPSQGAAFGVPCPYHTAIEHLQFLRITFPMICADMALFPNARGVASSKASV
eukprot:6492599-Amphidinium_carterae.2